MSKAQEFAIECIDYRPWADRKGGMAIIEICTQPNGHAIRIGDIELIRSHSQFEDTWVKPFWEVRYPDHVIPDYSQRESFKDAILAAVARYQRERGETR